MPDIERTLGAVLDVLQTTGVHYLLTGGLAVSYYGEPRLTHDVDIVVRLREQDIRPLVEALETGFEVDEESVRAALREGSAFNAVHRETGDKVDLWVLTADAFEQERFRRRKTVRALGRQLVLPTPEDLIVNKLEWYGMSDSERHFNDALGVLRLQSGGIDEAYVADWCRRKGLTELWRRLRSAAPPGR